MRTHLQMKYVAKSDANAAQDIAKRYPLFLHTIFESRENGDALIEYGFLFLTGTVTKNMN